MTLKPVMAIRSSACVSLRKTRAGKLVTSSTKVQAGKDPTDWRPMPTIGVGVREIRIRDSVGAYRVIYIASFPDAVHVLHAFQKKSQKTPRRELETAELRLRQLKRGSNR